MIPEGKSMGVPAYARQALRWLAATAVAALTTFLLVWLGANSTTAGMVFLVLVVWWATQSGTVLSVYTAVVCAICFDYFFLPPIHTFRIEGAQQWVAMISFAISCVVVSRLSERARQQTLQAEQRQADVGKLYELSQEMMLFEDADRLLHDLPGAINRIFSLQGVMLYVSDYDRFYPSSGDASASVQAHTKAVALGLSPAVAAFGGYQTTALVLGLKPVGALAWQPDVLSQEVATAVSAQVSIAVARSIAMEASTRIEAAREADRLRTAMIDSLTHELRTPLTSIRAAATTLLQGEGLDEAARLDMVRIIDEEAARLDGLIGEAVEMAEIDANVVQVKMSPQHPRALLDQAVEQSRKALGTHRVTILAEDGQADVDETAWFDPHLLGRVLRHLLENFAAHTPPGSRVTLSSTRTDERLEFSVEDNGPGIDARDLPLIFEKFYRGKQGAGRHKGTGMGLAITRAILKAHGGGIEASNVPGSGARFRFWVPLIEKEPSRR
ncbi:MAG: ATP-binding protein [Terracidiphilus sp.]|jgi:two-component system sensor histidine kinase KdpD